jgi:hypothetical protein
MSRSGDASGPLGAWPKRVEQIVFSASLFAYFFSGATEKKYAARRGGTRPASEQQCHS